MLLTYFPTQLCHFHDLSTSTLSPLPRILCEQRRVFNVVKPKRKPQLTERTPPVFPIRWLATSHFLLNPYMVIFYNHGYQR